MFLDVLQLKWMHQHRKTLLKNEVLCLKCSAKNNLNKSSKNKLVVWWVN